jgi:SAM-dependent methyltransferase
VPEDVFEEYAEDYDRWFDEHRDEYLSELARIRKVLPPPDSRAIEVGVGSGRFAAPLGITIGVEPSRALCRMARQQGIEVIRGRAEALPIRDESCSSVLMVTVICFLDDLFPVFRELHRILIPGGLLIVAFIDRGGQIHRKYLREGGKGRFLSRAKFYSSGEVQAFLMDTGFQVVRVDSQVGFSVMVAEKDQGTHR